MQLYDKICPGRKNFNIIGRIYIWILAAALFSASMYHCGLVFKADTNKNWPTVQGKIDRSWVERNVATGGARGIVTYHVKVSYSYTVNGSVYHSDQAAVGLGETSFSGDEARSAVNRKYPAGTSITVYYDPAHPKEAVLTPGKAEGVWFWIFLPLILSFFFWKIGRAIPVGNTLLVK